MNLAWEWPSLGVKCRYYATHSRTVGTETTVIYKLDLCVNRVATRLMSTDAATMIKTEHDATMITTMSGQAPECGV